MLVFTSLILIIDWLFHGDALLKTEQRSIPALSEEAA
jgi:hypothetical protein